MGQRKRHSPEQIIGKLREADAMLAGGASIAQVCQKLAVSEQTFHRKARLSTELRLKLMAFVSDIC